MQLNKESLSDQISKEIKNRIINVDINQGEKIDVGRLEEEFGVSRAPIRDALQSLVDQGLVEVKPRVGYFAINLSAEEIKDISEMRKLLETFALRKSITKIPQEELKSLQARTTKLKERKDNLPHEELRSRFDETDEKLHRVLIDNSDNSLLRDFTNRIHNLISLTRHLNERIGEAIEEHERLIKAMYDRDLEEAERALKDHIENVEEELLSNHTRKSLNGGDV